MKFSNLTNIRRHESKMFTDVTVTYGFWFWKRTRTETIQRADTPGDGWIDVETGVKFQSDELDGLLRAHEARKTLDIRIKENQAIRRRGDLINSERI